METIKEEIKTLIDNEFDVTFENTGNKLLYLSNRAKSIDIITQRAVNKCLDLLNNKYPIQAKEFAESGFVNTYILKKQKELLLW